MFPRRRTILIVLCGLLLAVFVWLLARGTMNLPTKLHSLAQAWNNKVFHQYFLNPEFWVVLALTLVLQRFLPAASAQRAFGIGFLQDLTWFFYEAALGAIVVGTYILWLKGYYERHWSNFTVTALAEGPVWLRFAVGVLAVDLLYWLQHWLHHRIPWLWELHAVHHSQREINFFTDFRYHALEYMVRNTILTVPFLLLKFETPIILAFAFLQRWHTRFYHGNIRTNLGPLRYLLVTPQSHRIHHSVEPRHFGKNYGSIFSFWDYLFGTQHREYGEYPNTGISDPDFPCESSRLTPKILLAPLLQHLYPLQKLWREKALSGRTIAGLELGDEAANESNR